MKDKIKMMTGPYGGNPYKTNELVINDHLYDNLKWELDYHIEEKPKIRLMFNPFTDRNEITMELLRVVHICGKNTLIDSRLTKSIPYDLSEVSYFDNPLSPMVEEMLREVLLNAKEQEYIHSIP